MENVISIIKLISDYGALLIIAGIFVYVVIRLINIGLKYVEGKLSKKDHDAAIDVRSNVNIKIQSLITDFLQAHNGTRIQVIEFTNSIMSVAYLPFRYMTCTYEVYRFGEQPNSHAIDHVSTSLFTPFFEILQANDYQIFDLADDTSKMGGAMYDIMNNSKQNKALCAMLTTYKGKALGYVALMKDEGSFSEADTEDIQSLASKLTALLSILDS